MRSFPEGGIGPAIAEALDASGHFAGDSSGFLDRFRQPLP
ncbi:MAG: hypothetical protein JWQ24_1000 [Tardiphaga sp.]|nr:hypothetical protein [Tardiphaga sp.]